MSRARNIKPGFFRNADLVELPMEARLLFIGLWTLADRAGRLEDRPKQIKIEVFPADNVDCDALLSLISSTGMLVRYEVDGKRYLQVANFTKHQNPHRDEKASTIPEQGFSAAAPAPVALLHDASTVQAPCNPDANTVAIGLNPDSRSLIADSLIPDPQTHTAATGESAGGQKPECVSLIETGFDALGDILPTGQGQDTVVIDRVAPTMAAAVCVAMRAERIADCNPSHPDINALLAQGAEIGLFASAAREAVKKGKGFAYALAIVKSQIAGAQKIAAASISKQTSKGAGHAKNAEEPI